jgi:hypothetical protein
MDTEPQFTLAPLKTAIGLALLGAAVAGLFELMTRNPNVATLAGVSAAAIAVLAVVRRMNRKPQLRKSRVAYRAMVVVFLTLLYALGFGPACWLASRCDGLRGTVSWAYWPLARAAWKCPTRRGLDALLWYGRLAESRANPSTRKVLNDAAPP